MTKIEDGEILELYSQGLTNLEIAERLKVSQPAIHYRLQKLGLRNNYHTEKTVNEEKVKLLHSMGLTTVGIALLLKTNVLVISECMKELELTDNYTRLKEIVSR